MVDERSKTVLQAHALRATQAKTALLHGSRYSTADLKRPYSAVWGGMAIAGLVMAVAIVIAVVTSLT